MNDERRIPSASQHLLVAQRYLFRLHSHPLDCSLQNDTAGQTPQLTKMAYEIRAGGDVKNKKQSMADLKLRRLNELNSRLREDLERPRIKVSEASMS